MLRYAIFSLCILFQFSTTHSLAEDLTSKESVSVEERTAKEFVYDISQRLQITLIEAKNKNLLNDTPYVNRLVRDEILPHVEIDALCQRIFKKHWADIVAKGKKQEAIDAVVESLKRTYRIALATYNGENIDIIGSKDQKAYSIVRILIKTDGNGDHTIDFAIRQFNDQWKVFDFSVDGVVVSKTLNGSIERQIDTEGIDKALLGLNPNTTDS